MMRTWVQVGLCVLLVCGTLAVGPVAAQGDGDSDTPYIYYYSYAHNAFVIERADGTDTRLLGEGLMTLDEGAESIHVAGPGWSPSGKWFAWTESQVYAAGAPWSGYAPYVLSADGTQRLILPDTLRDAQLAWSKNEDVLFVVSHQTEQLNRNDPGDSHSTIDLYLAIIDVPTGTILGQIEERTFSDYYLYQPGSIRPKLVQTKDGEHVIVLFNDIPGGGSYKGTAVVYILDAAGGIVERQLNAFGPVNIDDQLYYAAFPSISPAGWLVYPTENGFYAGNLLSGRHLSFPALIAPSSIAWDPSGQFALVMDDDLWLLDCVAEDLTILRDSWEVHDPYFYVARPMWSPEGSRAILFGMADPLYGFDKLSGGLREVQIDIDKSFDDDFDWYWLDESRAVFYQTSQPGLTIYDFDSFTVQYIDVDLATETQPRLSPDERYIAFVREGAVIYDRDAKIELRARPDYRSFNSVFGGEIIWHESGEWLLIFEDALVAGGGHMRYLGIVRADGTRRRDLSFSWAPNPIALNWLPPRVDPVELPPPVETSPLPQPTATLHGSHWSFYVDWSPDGRWIAAGLDWASGGEITVWEIETREIIHVFENAEEDERVEWSQDGESVPKLMIPNHVPVWRIAQILARSPDGRQEVKILGSATVVADAATSEVIVRLNNQGEWDPTLTAAAYSPDGEWLAAINPYRPLRVWRTDTFEPVSIPKIPGQGLAFSPDSTQIALTSSWDVQIWDVADLLAWGAQEQAE